MDRHETSRVYRCRIGRVIDHIKDHLAGPLPFDELARPAHFSPFPSWSTRMTRKPLLAFALILACSPAAWSADEKDDSLEGTWLPSAAELGGKQFPDEVREMIKLVIKGDQYAVTVGTNSDKGTCKRDSSKKPKTLDITGTEGPNQGKTILAIYERDGDTLRVCYDLSGKSRPAEFSTKPGTPLFLVTYKRERR